MRSFRPKTGDPAPADRATVVLRAETNIIRELHLSHRPAIRFTVENEELRMKTIHDVPYDAIGNKLDIYLPENDTFDTVVFFHGGGIVSGDKADWAYTEIAKEFVQKGYAFVSVNYRLYPNAKFPDYLIDARNAVRYAFDHMGDYGHPSRMIVSGQSAGAYLTLMLALDKKWLHGVSLDPKDISAWLVDSAQITSHFNVIQFEKGLDPRMERIDEYAPLYYLDENSAFDNMLLIYYKDDRPSRPEQNLLFHSAVKRFLPAVNLKMVCLPGEHCHGSGCRNENGEFDYCNAAFEFLESLE